MMTKALLTLLPIFLSYVCVSSFPRTVFIGSLFDQDEEIQRMLESSVNAVNKDRHEDNELSNIFLELKTEKIEPDMLMEVKSRVCDLLEWQIVGIFGPEEKTVAKYVENICDTMEIPYISVRPDSDEFYVSRGLALNLYPHVNVLSKFYNQLVTELKWKSFAILYENTDSLVRMRLLLEKWNTGDSAVLYQLKDGPDYRQEMQEIKKSKIENIIIDCSYEILDEILKQAQQVGILSNKHRIIVTSLDLQTLDLDPYQYSGVNLTGIRLIDTKDPTVIKIWERHRNEWGLDDPSKLRVQPALMYDAVQLFARAFKQLKDATKGDVKKLPCDGSDRWEHGLSLSNFMRSIKTRYIGLTGFIKFDNDGFRNNIKLDVVHLTETGLSKIGEWNSVGGKNISWLPPEVNITKSGDLDIQNKTFIVLISTTEPYGMQKQSTDMLSGNDRYEGYAVDVIQKISEILKFNYTLDVENNYGNFSKNEQKWTGMLGKIMYDEADLAITDLTITSKRLEVVDFTHPIMNLGISILYKKPSKAAPNLFSFLLPFSSAVWYYLIGAYIIVSLLFFIIGRLCPSEWNNPYPCIEEPEMLENQFTVKNAFWFAIGAIMQQGSEIAPIGISTRMLASCWWFFCLIMVSSYTANLAAFLTTETLTKPFDNIEELARKKNIKYGAKKLGSTLAFFQTSQNPTYKMMYEYMDKHENELLVENNNDGIAKAEKEDYAFFMESSSIEYAVERHCTLNQVGDLLDTKSYGIAIKKNSPYLNSINEAILQLLESGTLAEIKKTWWTQKRGAGKCKQNGGTTSAQALTLSNVGGVFLVLIIGVILSCLYTICELLWDVAQTYKRENMQFKEKLISELKFIITCSSTKPVGRKNGLSSKSENDSTRECTPPYGFIPTIIKTSPADNK